MLNYYLPIRNSDLEVFLYSAECWRKTSKVSLYFIPSKNGKSKPTAGEKKIL